MLIGEVARRSGVSARMLRHYDALGLVRPTGRSVGGYREYSGDDIRRILHVESLRSLGLTLREVGRALDDPEFDPSGIVDELIRQTEERIGRERELLTRLRHLDAAEPADWDAALGVVALLQGLGSESARVRQRAALAAAGGTTTTGAAAPVELLVEAALAETDPNVAGALRWALRRSGGDGLTELAAGLTSADADVRRRAVALIAQIPDDEATALLGDALADPDVAVRRSAALALGARGVADAVPTLVAMVVDGVNDVDAADALGALAQDGDLADRIAADLVAQLDDATTPVRQRIVQALADLPGDAATSALADLARSDERSIALTAAYVLRQREGRTE
ncbi:HEAT repeat domain-containing protein [Jiangella sp. DSM 45060]|uniref:HEAT repeat domain-containing protein n=1 Tax=Jiangella sp. DSM 45060 TaxID=1798224 RepID=UPI00087C8277|nr:HEAT repeat domain-containing protein [Jiangella sp. DSM 45060]SDS81445.1 DNA-binding transcriptional regulator, MerR family [Jiangella sp. DSM 45060]